MRERLTIKQLSDRWQFYSEASIREIVKRDSFPGKKIKGKWIIDAEAAEEWLDKQILKERVS